MTDSTSGRVCSHGDPTCPCQDGDVCHYEATEDTPAMTPGRGLTPERDPYCPSPTARGRTDRCGYYAYPQRCSPARCSLVDPPCRYCGQRLSVAVEGCMGAHASVSAPARTSSPEGSA